MFCVPKNIDRNSNGKTQTHSKGSLLNEVSNKEVPENESASIDADISLDKTTQTDKILPPEPSSPENEDTHNTEESDRTQTIESPSLTHRVRITTVRAFEGVNRNNSPFMVVDGHVFVIHIVGHTFVHTRWRCVNYKKTKCPAILFRSDNNLRLIRDHNHRPLATRTRHYIGLKVGRFYLTRYCEEPTH